MLIRWTEVASIYSPVEAVVFNVLNDIFLPSKLFSELMLLTCSFLSCIELAFQRTNAVYIRRKQQLQQSRWTGNNIKIVHSTFALDERKRLDFLTEIKSKGKINVFGTTCQHFRNMSFKLCNSGVKRIKIPSVLFCFLFKINMNFTLQNCWYSELRLETGNYTSRWILDSWKPEWLYIICPQVFLSITFLLFAWLTISINNSIKLLRFLNR